MKGGIFWEMTPAKKVQFIERVEKTKLGLEGIQIVVIADKCSLRDTNQENISFAKLGKRCINEVNGKVIQEEFPELEKECFKNKLHEKRVEWMKKNT